MTKLKHYAIAAVGTLIVLTVMPVMGLLYGSGVLAACGWYSVREGFGYASRKLTQPFPDPAEKTASGASGQSTQPHLASQ